MLAICHSLSIFSQTCSKFINLSGRPALKDPALKAGQDEKKNFGSVPGQVRAMQLRATGQGRAGQKKVPCDGL